MSTDLDRATGALLGLAVGDALGMPTQELDRAEVRRLHGDLVAGFAPAPADHPVAAGLPAGTVTDDTEQALLLARLLVAGGGRVDPVGWARALADWAATMAARGATDLLGPSTRRALAAVAAGTPPEEAGRTGDTNGAAMRIAPVGVAVPIGVPGGTDRLADSVAAVSRVTHGTDVALAGAVAIAAAVSTGVGGGDVDAALSAAVAAAPLGAARGHRTAAPDLATLLLAAVELGTRAGPAVVLDAVVAGIGTGVATTESVPAALAVLAAIPGDPWLACRTAASLGGDSDTIAALVGAVAGACHGTARFPAAARATVEGVNDLDLAGLAAGLLALRGRG